MPPRTTGLVTGYVGGFWLSVYFALNAMFDLPDLVDIAMDYIIRFTLAMAIGLAVVYAISLVSIAILDRAYGYRR